MGPSDVNVRFMGVLQFKGIDILKNTSSSPMILMPSSPLYVNSVRV